MAEINKRNLVDEVAAVYATNVLASNPEPLFSTGVPAKIARVSMANTNLLRNDGDLFVGTGDTYTETIDETTYTYAKIAKKNQSELFVDGLNSTATNVGLAANVGKFINDRLCISNSTASGIGSIAMGYNASTTNDQAIAIGYEAIATGGSTAIGNGAKISTAITNAIQLGSGTNSTMNSFQVWEYQMLDFNTGKIPLERINQIDGTTSRSLCLGGTPGGQDCTVLGYNSSVGGTGGTAIGSSARANPYDFESKSGSGSCGVAIGVGTYGRGNTSIAIGCNARVGDYIGAGNTICDEAIAIGYKAVVTHVTENVGAIQLGKGTNSTGGFQVWDYQLMDENGMIPNNRIAAQIKYLHSMSIVQSVVQDDVKKNMVVISFSFISSSGDKIRNGEYTTKENITQVYKDIAQVLIDNGCGLISNTLDSNLNFTIEEYSKVFGCLSTNGVVIEYPVSGIYGLAYKISDDVISGPYLCYIANLGMASGTGTNVLGYLDVGSNKLSVIDNVTKIYIPN